MSLIINAVVRFGFLSVDFIEQNIRQGFEENEKNNSPSRQRCFHHYQSLISFPSQITSTT